MILLDLAPTEQEIAALESGSAGAAAVIIGITAVLAAVMVILAIKKSKGDKK